VTDLKRIADALERIAAAQERLSPPPKTQHEYQVEREFDYIAERMFLNPRPGGTIFTDGVNMAYVCRFCNKEIISKHGDLIHNCREPKP